MTNEEWPAQYNPATGGGYESDQVMADRLAITYMEIAEEDRADREQNGDADGS